MTVLILAHDSDKVADRVTAELCERGTHVVTLNPSAFPMKMSIGAYLYGSGSRWSGLISHEDGREVELDSVSAVWQRRATPFVMDERMSAPERAFAYGEARRGFGGTLIALDRCLWVNDPMAAARAEYKPLQLATAAKLGLEVPRTLITTEPQAACDWADDIGRPIVYKSLDATAHADEGQVRVIYTKPITDLESLRDPSFGLTAHMLQEQIPKEFETRVTVIGAEVFAVRIDAGTEEARVDWRSDYSALTYTVFELPADLRDRLRELMARLGLVFGVFDLIFDTSGRWVFLEVNQGGEFGWLAEETGLPMYGSVADLLEKGA